MRSFLKNVLFAALIVASTSMWAQQRPKDDLPIGKRPLTMAQQKKILFGDQTVAAQYYNTSPAQVRKDFINSLNAWAQHDGWVLENGSQVVFVEENLEKYFEKYFIEALLTFKEGELEVNYVDRETKQVFHYAYRGNKPGEMGICMDPNKIDGINNKGSLVVRPIASEQCENGFGPVLAKSIDEGLPPVGNSNVNEDGEVIAEKTPDIKHVYINGNDKDTIIYKNDGKEGGVTVIVLNKLNTIQQGGDVNNTTNPTTATASSGEDMTQPYQNLSEITTNKVETVYVKEIVQSGQPLQDNSYVEKDGRWFKYRSGVGLIAASAVALIIIRLILLNNSNSVVSYGAYNRVIPATVYNNVEGRAGTSVTQYGNVEAVLGW